MQKAFLIIDEIMPESILKLVKPLKKHIRLNFLYHKWRVKGHPPRQGETFKAKGRRIREGFFEKFCQGKGLDIGYGGDILSENCRGWDIEHGDAQYLYGIKDSTFDFVYSSHTLEHMKNLNITLGNWWRVLNPGGFLILYLPHRDLFEKITTLPSCMNPDHQPFLFVG